MNSNTRGGDALLVHGDDNPILAGGGELLQVQYLLHINFFQSICPRRRPTGLL